MADTPPPPSSSKAIVFARRSGSTVLLWSLVAAVFMSRWSWAYLGLIGLLVIIATREYFRMMRAANVPCFPRFGMLVAVGYSGVLYASLQSGSGVSSHLDAMAVFVCITGAFTLALRQPVRGNEPLVATAVSLLGFLSIAWLFNFAARLVFLVPDADALKATPQAPVTCCEVLHGLIQTPPVVSVPGAYLLLWLLAVTKFTDMGAYVTGSLIGRHKMIPHISPGKTWEGFAGALIFSQLAGCALYAAFPDALSALRSWGHVLTLGFLLAVLAVLGDLAESMLKRALNAKDSGTMLPGIGGAMDLIDSLCFTAPALFFYLKWLLPHTR